MPSISAGLFLGNAARRLSRPTRCSGSQGPTVRKKAAAKFAMRSGSNLAMALSTTTASALMTALAARLSLKATIGHSTQTRGKSQNPQHNLPKYLPLSNPRQAGLKFEKRQFEVD